jgi:hypothetical protein
VEILPYIIKLRIQCLIKQSCSKALSELGASIRKHMVRLQFRVQYYESFSKYFRIKQILSI